MFSMASRGVDPAWESERAIIPNKYWGKNTFAPKIRQKAPKYVDLLAKFQKFWGGRPPSVVSGVPRPYTVEGHSPHTPTPAAVSLESLAGFLAPPLFAPYPRPKKRWIDATDGILCIGVLWLGWLTVHIRSNDSVNDSLFTYHYHIIQWES